MGTVLGGGEKKGFKVVPYLTLTATGGGKNPWKETQNTLCPISWEKEKYICMQKTTAHEEGGKKGKKKEENF